MKLKIYTVYIVHCTLYTVYTIYIVHIHNEHNQDACHTTLGAPFDREVDRQLTLYCAFLPFSAFTSWESSGYRVVSHKMLTIINTAAHCCIMPHCYIMPHYYIIAHCCKIPHCCKMPHWCVIQKEMEK